jgi:hypothetical protein
MPLCTEMPDELVQRLATSRPASPQDEIADFVTLYSELDRDAVPFTKRYHPTLSSSAWRAYIDLRDALDHAATYLRQSAGWPPDAVAALLSLTHRASWGLGRLERDNDELRQLAGAPTDIAH